MRRCNPMVGDDLPFDALPMWYPAMPERPSISVRLRVAWALLLELLLGSTGCSALLYTPTPHVAPMLEGPGETEVMVRLDPDQGVSGYVAASPLPNLVGFVARAPEGGYDSTFAKRYTEWGGGLYVGDGPFRRYEFLVGVGQGRIQTVDAPLFEGPFRYTLRERRHFVQVNVSAYQYGRRNQPDRSFQAIFSLRLAQARYEETRIENLDTGSPLRTRPGFGQTFVEGGAQMRAGLGPATFHLQIGMSRPVADHLPADFHYTPLFAAVGVGLRFDALPAW
ncbi:MAG: hypothetical protein AAF970_13770 [Bacteroidota bacterium]